MILQTTSFILNQHTMISSDELPPGYHGNELVERYGYMEKGARKSWVVESVHLVGGQLQTFSFYAMEHG